ncbi:MAG: hypothetical protein HKO57_00635, partial [Akkermansiaceae bacterium]|nr:hypothetical protein [Akkermansiaceae bacterium]
MRSPSPRSVCLLPALAGLLCAAMSPRAEAGGVTLVTHGFNGNVTDWVIPMADRIPGHPGFEGTEVSCYQLVIVENNSGQLEASAALISGSPGDLAGSGEIFVKLDWSNVDGGSRSSTEIAELAVAALVFPGLIPDLDGRPLTELPLHLIGHSRGGSVVSEMARFCGARGLWVDQVTTLDPVPVATFGDAAVRAWENVLFADNYWQVIGGFFVPTGQPVSGAYNRELTDLGGGYGSAHSDVHLWYHGTIELGTPATDTQATITSSERSSWWVGSEAAGAATGFQYSRIGGGDRLSSFEPAGSGTGAISDGFNRAWDLGGGVTGNRAALPANSGEWPNIIRCLLATSGPVTAGGSFDLEVYHQSGAGASGDIEVRTLLDPDGNPWNGNETEVGRHLLPNTGTNLVRNSTLTVATDPAGVAPGAYAVLTAISDGTRTRYLYAPEGLVVLGP